MTTSPWPETVQGTYGSVPWTLNFLPLPGDEHVRVTLSLPGQDPEELNVLSVTHHPQWNRHPVVVAERAVQATRTEVNIGLARASRMLRDAEEHWSVHLSPGGLSDVYETWALRTLERAGVPYHLGPHICTRAQVTHRLRYTPAGGYTLRSAAEEDLPRRVAVEFAYGCFSRATMNLNLPDAMLDDLTTLLALDTELLLRERAGVGVWTTRAELISAPVTLEQAMNNMRQNDDELNAVLTSQHQALSEATDDLSDALVARHLTPYLQRGRKPH